MRWMYDGFGASCLWPYLRARAACAALPAKGQCEVEAVIQVRRVRFGLVATNVGRETLAGILCGDG